jgi:DNA mismatch repair protein MSH4
MAQLGCFVPAEFATVRVADAIFSRFGTGDSIECNASTFALEMKEIAYILGGLSATSLVVLDEPGRGTSSDEGAAVCWAICEEILGTNAFCFVATHYRLLTRLETMYCSVTK